MYRQAKRNVKFVGIFNPNFCTLKKNSSADIKKRNPMKQSASLIILLVFLPGCRAVRWAEEHFEQGQEVAGAKMARAVVKDTLRSVSIYHEFDTVGLFDVLLLTPAVRQAYVDTYAAKYHVSPDEKEKLIREQRKESENTVTFIVMAYMPENTMPVGDDKSLWSVVLQGERKPLTPFSSKSHELNPEYEYFLKDKISKHKYIYLVKFDIEKEKPRKDIELTLATVDRKVTLKWTGGLT
jgi:hypothetical protein